MPKKMVKIGGLFLLFIFMVVLIFSSPVIFQEGNPLPVAYGIIKLSLTSDTSVKIDKNKYLLRATTEDVNKLTDYLARNNIVLVDRAGSGFLFKDKDGSIYTASTRMYSSYFEILEFAKQQKPELVLP